MSYLRNPALLLCLLMSPMLALGQVEVEKPKVPEAQTLIDRHVKETGGAEAYLAIKNYEVKGAIVTQVGRDLAGTIELKYLRHPDPEAKGKEKVRICYHMILDLGEALRVEKGSDGITHWMITSYDGVSLVSEVENQKLLADFDMAAIVRPKSYYESFKTLGKVLVGKRPAWEVEVKRIHGERREFMRFDVETGVLLGNKFIEATENGDVVSSTDILSWRDFGKIKIADETLDKGPGFKQTTSFKSGGVNVEMSLDDFKVPQAVRAHQEKPEPAGDGKTDS